MASSTCALVVDKQKRDVFKTDEMVNLACERTVLKSGSPIQNSRYDVIFCKKNRFRKRYGIDTETLL